MKTIELLAKELNSHGGVFCPNPKADMQLWNTHNPFRACLLCADGHMVMWEYKNSPFLVTFNPLVKELRSGATFFYLDGIDGHGPHGAFGIADADTAVGLASRDGAVFPTFCVAATESDCRAWCKTDFAKAIGGKRIDSLRFFALGSTNWRHD